MPLPDIADLNPVAVRARAQAEVFSLPMRDRHWRGSAGEYAGAGAGSSLDFQDHRLYLPGDDPRHINWQAFARNGQYSLKLYREEVRPVVEVLCDVSDSLFADPAKGRRLVELLYFVFASAERAGASTSLYLLKGPRWKAVEAGAVLKHGWLDPARELPSTEASAPPRPAAVPLRARSLRVLLSDLLFPSAPEPLLRTLVRSQGKALVLAPFSPDEASPDWSGNCEFVDSESGTLHPRRVDSALLARYGEAYRDHFSRWKTASLRCRVPLARVSSHPPFAEAVKQEALPAGALLLA